MGMIMHDDVPYGEGTSYTQGTGIAINNNIIAVDADNTPTENSEKPVKSKGVHSALEANREESASLLKSTVGWTGKNELPITLDMLKAGNTGGTWSGNTYTQNGVVFTVTTNDEGYVTEIDTYTATSANANTSLQLTENKYIPNDFVGYNATGCSDGTTNYYFNINYSMNGTTWESQVNQTTTAVEIANKPYIKLAIFVGSGETVNHKKSYPMFAKKEYVNLPFAPYHPPVSDWGYTRQEANVLGAKQWFFDEVYGLAFYSDTIGANTIISIAHSSFIAKVDKNTDYTISREGGNRFRVGLSTAFPANNVSCNLLVNDPNMKSFTFNSGNYEYVMAWMENATDTAENIKPLCTLASDTDRTYKKFAMTNRELTELVAKDRGTIVAGYEYERFGGFCLINVNAEVTVSAGTWTIIASRLPFRTNNIARAWFRTVDGNKAVQAVVEDVQSSYTQFQIRCEEALSNVTIRGQIIYGIRE